MEYKAIATHTEADFLHECMVHGIRTRAEEVAAIRMKHWIIVDGEENTHTTIILADSITD